MLLNARCLQDERLLFHLECLLTLAEARHFGSAAKTLKMSQSAFSQAIQTLESMLGVAVVHRTRRFDGFSEEGMVVLGHARNIVGMVEKMRQAVDLRLEGVTGEFRLGTVPSTLFTIPALTQHLHRRFPKLSFVVEEHTFDELARKLREDRIAAALTYFSPDGLEGILLHRLYNERYVLLAPTVFDLGESTTIGWRDAGALPLGALQTSMRLRHIIDDAFTSVQVSARPVVESNSMLALLAHVAAGACAVVVPANFIEVVPMPAGTRALELVDPDIRMPVCLAVSQSKLDSPIGRALLEFAAAVSAS